MSAIPAVWGFEAESCDGLIAGAILALITLGLHVFLKPEVVLIVRLTWMASDSLATGLARTAQFRHRLPGGPG